VGGRGALGSVDIKHEVLGSGRTGLCKEIIRQVNGSWEGYLWRDVYVYILIFKRVAEFTQIPSPP
jgi:hypothetical protein